MIPWIMSGSLIRAMPPWARMSAGTRSSAMTATAPASSAIFACSGVTTSMMTPPLSCSAMPRFTSSVPDWGTVSVCGATGCCLCSTDRSASSYGRSEGRFAHAVRAGAGTLGAHLDVEEPGDRPGGVQAQHPGESTTPQLPGVPDGVVVEAPGQPHPGGGAGEVGLQCRRHAAELLGQLPQFTTQRVLRQLAVPVGRLPCVRGKGGQV